MNTTGLNGRILDNHWMIMDIIITRWYPSWIVVFLDDNNTRWSWMIMDENGQWWTIIGWPWIITCNWILWMTTDTDDWRSWIFHASHQWRCGNSLDIDDLVRLASQSDWPVASSNHQGRCQETGDCQGWGPFSNGKKTDGDDEGYALKDAEFLLQKFQKEELNSLTSTRNCQNDPKWPKMIQNDPKTHQTYHPKLIITWKLGRCRRVFQLRRVQPWGRWSFARTRPGVFATKTLEVKGIEDHLKHSKTKDLFHYPTHTYAHTHIYIKRYIYIIYIYIYKIQYNVIEYNRI